jgi:myo-inositol-1(or 4)-monophosphatase
MPLQNPHSQDMHAELRQIAVDAVRQVGPGLAQAFRQAMSIEMKRDRHDLVTEHDRASERVLRDFLSSAAPGSSVVGEEFGRSGEGEVTWYIDPIDGTANFARGLAFWCTSIGAAVDGQPVAGAIYDPVADHLFSVDSTASYLNDKPITAQAASRTEEAVLIFGYPSADDLRRDGNGPALERFGALVEAFATVRRPGSAALSIAHVAAGWADAAAGFSVHAWDVAAALPLLERAGGRFQSFAFNAENNAGVLDCPGYVATGRGVDYPLLNEIAGDIARQRSACVQSASAN